MIDDRTPNLNLPLPNVDNTLAEDVARLRSALDAIDAEIAAKQAALGFTPENVANKGAAGGYAALDGSGKVPAGQLPSFVDDVLEFANYAALPGTGKAGKIYVLLTPYTSGGLTSSQFRWSGSAYIPIVESPGTTDALAEGATNLYFTAARARAAQNIATASVLGLVKVGPSLQIDGEGQLDVNGSTQTFSDTSLTIDSNGQTVFAIAGGYSPDLIDVHLNGVKLVGGGDDYTASNGTSITLTAGVNTADSLTLRRWSVFNVAEVPFANITAKPTTLAGFGITDAAKKLVFTEVAGTTGTAAVGEHKGLRNAAVTTITGPASAVTGDLWAVSVENDRQDNVIDFNGLNHMGISDSTMIITAKNVTLFFEYHGPAYGWKIY